MGGGRARGAGRTRRGIREKGRQLNRAGRVLSRRAEDKHSRSVHDFRFVSQHLCTAGSPLIEPKWDRFRSSTAKAHNIFWLNDLNIGRLSTCDFTCGEKSVCKPIRFADAA